MMATKNLDDVFKKWISGPRAAHIHSKSERIGGTKFSAQKKLAEKCTHNHYSINTIIKLSSMINNNTSFLLIIILDIDIRGARIIRVSF